MGLQCSPGCRVLCQVWVSGSSEGPCRTWAWAECERGCWAVWELPGVRVCGFVSGHETGRTGALCAYPRVWRVLKALEHGWWLVSRGKAESAQSPDPYLGKWGGRSVRFRTQGILRWRYSPVCPKNVCARENLVIQEGPVLPGCALSKKLHTTLESHLYKYLKCLISKIKVLFVETKENKVFLRKIRKFKLPFVPLPGANFSHFGVYYSR